MIPRACISTALLTQEPGHLMCVTTTNSAAPRMVSCIMNSTHANVENNHKTTLARNLRLRRVSRKLPGRLNSRARHAESWKNQTLRAARTPPHQVSLYDSPDRAKGPKSSLGALTWARLLSSPSVRRAELEKKNCHSEIREITFTFKLRCKTSRIGERKGMSVV